MPSRLQRVMSTSIRFIRYGIRATRAAGYERLLQSARERLATLCAHGVTTVEGLPFYRLGDGEG